MYVRSIHSELIEFPRKFLSSLAPLCSKFGETSGLIEQNIIGISCINERHVYNAPELQCTLRLRKTRIENTNLDFLSPHHTSMHYL